MQHLYFDVSLRRIIKRSFLFVLAILLASTLYISTFSQAVSAKTSAEMTLDERALSYATLNALRLCVKSSNGKLADWNGILEGSAISESNARAGTWFQKNTGYEWNLGDPNREAGSYLNDSTDVDTNSNDGWTLCNNILKKGISLWGFNNGLDLLCTFVEKRMNGSSCSTGSENFGWISEFESGLDTAIKNRVYGGKSPELTDEARYLLYRDAFIKGCKAKQSASPSADYRYENIRIVKEDGTYEDVTYEGVKRDQNRRVFVTGNLSTTIKSCADIAKDVNTYAKAYSTYRENNKGEPTGGSVDSDCNGENPPPSCTTEGTVSCIINGVGWILCPVMEFMAGITDAAYSFVAGLLVVQPLLITGEDQGIYGAWTVMRNLANIAFVIVFLIIMFSQLTSLGVSNYGIKKMLPRLVIAAILVNLSYWICAIAVDLSNIAGASMKTLFDNLGGGLENPISEESPLNTNGWLGLVGGVLAAAGATAAIMYLHVSILIPALIAAVLAIVTVFIVLTLRQALIILLIVIAPLAFVAYLLPNTEDLFTKWRKFLTTLLLMFPIIAAIFGASALAAQVVMASSDNIAIQIMGALISILPLAITPIVMKTAGGVLNRFGGIVNNAEKGPFDRMRKAGDRYREGRTNLIKARGLNGNDKMIGRGALNRWRGRRQAIYSGRETEAKEAQRDYVAEQLGNSPAFATAVAGGDPLKGARLAVKAEAAIESEDLKEALQPLLRELETMDPSKKRAHLDKEIAAGGSRQAAALHYAAQIGDTGYLRSHLAGVDSTGAPAGRDASGSPVARSAEQQDEVTRRIRGAIGANTGSIIGKAPDLVKGDGAAFGSVKGADLAQFKPDTAKAYMSYLTKLHTNASVPNATQDDIQKYQIALNGFNSAVEDITKSPELQAAFGGEVGAEIQKEAIKMPFRNEMHGLAAIQQDGKIR